MLSGIAFVCYHESCKLRPLTTLFILFCSISGAASFTTPKVYNTTVIHKTHRIDNESPLTTWETVFVCIGVILLLVTMAIIITWYANRKSPLNVSIMFSTSVDYDGYDTFDTNSNKYSNCSDTFDGSSMSKSEDFT